MKKNNFLSILIVLLFVLFTPPALLLSQEAKTDSEAMESQTKLIARDFSDRLKSQLNLDEEQTKNIREIIAYYIDYKTGVSKSGDKDSTEEAPAEQAETQIVKLLNGVQQSGWSTVKDGFWSDLNKRISIATEDKRRKDNQE